MNRLSFMKEQVKTRVSITQVVEYYSGRKLEKGKCHCPLHNEKTPSFFVNEQKGVFYCQGCGAGGDQISFLMKYLGIGFKDAVVQIDKDFNLELSNERISVKAQIQAREHKKQRALELQEQARKNAEYNQLCEEYILVNSVLSRLTPLTEIWGNMISKKNYLEYKLDNIMNDLK